MKIINTTAHPIRFQDHWEYPNEPCKYCGWYSCDGSCTDFTVEPCGTVISALPVEELAGQHSSGAELVRTRFEATPDAEAELSRLERENPGAIIVGSIIAAQAFPGRVFALVPTPGYERVIPAEKRMLPDKFTVF